MRLSQITLHLYKDKDLKLKVKDMYHLKTAKFMHLYHHNKLTNHM